jgi:hypothetical protein
MIRTVLTRTAAVALGSLLAVGLAPAARTDAASPPPVTHRTLYATHGDRVWSLLQRLTLDRTGRVVSGVAVAPDGSRFDQATDVSAAGLLFVSHGTPDRIVFHPRTGSGHFVLPGVDAVFSPGATAVLVVRRDGQGTEKYDELHLYSLANRTTSLVTALPPGQVVTDLRYSLDGRSLWMHTVRSAGGAVGLQQYRFADHRIVRTIPLNGTSGCPDLEILPSGQRAVLTCTVPTAGGTRGELWTVHLATGTVVRRTLLPAGRFVDTIHGRLSPTQLLVSAHSRRADGGTLEWLGALDIAAMSVRSLPGSTSRHSAAVAY